MVSIRADGRGTAKRCPSFLRIALFEAGDLPEVPTGATVRSHILRCPRCTATVRQIARARLDILDPRRSAFRRVLHQILGSCFARASAEDPPLT